MVPLGTKASQHLKMVFQPLDWIAAERMLMEHCGENLPDFDEDSPVPLEKVRVAVINLSDGWLVGMYRWIEKAQQDWRPVLQAYERGEPGDGMGKSGS